MKQITIEFSKYKLELMDAYNKGYVSALKDVIDYLKGDQNKVLSDAEETWLEFILALNKVAWTEFKPPKFEAPKKSPLNNKIHSMFKTDLEEEDTKL